MTRVPAGMATRPSARTSRVTRASMRSSTRAVSLVIEVTTFRPTTDDAGTTTATNSGLAGTGGTSGIAGTIAVVPTAVAAEATSG